MTVKVDRQRREQAKAVETKIETSFKILQNILTRSLNQMSNYLKEN